MRPGGYYILLINTVLIQEITNTQLHSHVYVQEAKSIKYHNRKPHVLALVMQESKPQVYTL